MKEELFEGFFSDGAEFWIGKVVDIEAQKTSAQGFSWGWRYKVRIFGTYSNSDNIEDKDCHTAMVMLGVTDGSGGAGRTRAVRVTQHDIVFGLTENQEFNECDSVNIPKVVENSKQGDGVGREVNETQLEQMGESTTESNVNTRTEPEGSTQYDTEGLEQSEIDEAIAEEKEFIATQNGDYSDSKIITETDAEREELKNLLEFD